MYLRWWTVSDINFLMILWTCSPRHFDIKMAAVWTTNKRHSVYDSEIRCSDTALKILNSDWFIWKSIIAVWRLRKQCWSLHDDRWIAEIRHVRCNVFTMILHKSIYLRCYVLETPKNTAQTCDFHNTFYIIPLLYIIYFTKTPTLAFMNNFITFDHICSNHVISLAHRPCFEFPMSSSYVKWFRLQGSVPQHCWSNHNLLKVCNLTSICWPQVQKIK
jgi:hypothetical protein